MARISCPFLRDGSAVPHSDYFYYFGVHLCAVRSGPWKLHVMKREYGKRHRPEPLIKCEPVELYNLDNDAGERHNVAAENPGVVETLQGIAREFQDAVRVGKLPSHIGAR